MKRLLPFLSLAILISSCSKSDENGKIENKNSIIGTWITSESRLNGMEVNSQEKVKFTENSVSFYYNSNISESGKYSISNDIITIKWDESDPGMEEYILNIIELNDTTLKWEADISGEGNLKETLKR